MNKKQIVKAINALPGPTVTTRARKDTLLEILRERQDGAVDYEAGKKPMPDMAQDVGIKTTPDMTHEIAPYERVYGIIAVMFIVAILIWTFAI